MFRSIGTTEKNVKLILNYTDKHVAIVNNAVDEVKKFLKTLDISKRFNDAFTRVDTTTLALTTDQCATMEMKHGKPSKHRWYHSCSI